MAESTSKLRPLLGLLALILASLGLGAPSDGQEAHTPTALPAAVDATPGDAVDAYMDFIGITPTAASVSAPGEMTGTGGWVEIPLERFGFNDALRTYNTQSVFGCWFYTRRDRITLAAKFDFSLIRGDDVPSEIRVMEVWVNEEMLARYDASDLKTGERVRSVPIDSRILGVKNLLVIRIYTYDTGPCQNVVTPGTWRIIQSGALKTRGTPLPLPNALDILPLPFFDPDADKNIDVDIPIAFFDEPSEASIAAAGLVASYFGMKGGSKLRFPTSYTSIPDGNAVVLITAQSPQARFMTGIPTGPAIRLVDHPDHLGSNQKLLILEGRDSADLLVAARRLALGTDPLRGPELKIEGENVNISAKPYDAPKWLRRDRSTKFGDLPGGNDLIHRGHAGAMVKLDFRVPPDLFTWPRDHILSTIEFTQLLPVGYECPKIDVELNGDFLQTLPRLQGTGTAEPHRVLMRLPRSRLRGTNTLIFHIAAIAQDPLCTADSHRFVQTRITGNSVFHLEGSNAVSVYPDMSAFIYDGWPFTKNHDLSSTELVMPKKPTAEELGAALSYLGHFSAVTGYPTTKVTVRLANNLPEDIGVDKNKDLLYVGAAPNLPVLQAWAGKLPLSFAGSTATVRTPGFWDWTMALLSGRLPSEGTSGAAFQLSQGPTGQVMQLESPLRNGRVAVVVTGPTPGSVPALADLWGFADARSDNSDLLLVHGGARSMFNVGPSFTSGPMGMITYLRYTAAKYWTSLVIISMFAALLLTGVLYRRLKIRELARLAVGRRR